MEQCKVIFNPHTNEYLQSFINNELSWTDSIYHCYLFVNDHEFSIALSLCGEVETDLLLEIKTVYYNG